MLKWDTEYNLYSIKIKEKGSNSGIEHFGSIIEMFVNFNTPSIDLNKISDEDPLQIKVSGIKRYESKFLTFDSIIGKKYKKF